MVATFSPLVLHTVLLPFAVCACVCVFRYVDTILSLITLAGDCVSEDIWYRVVQIVTNHEELQEYAATSLYNTLQSPSIHESGIKVGAYVLGEFGPCRCRHRAPPASQPSLAAGLDSAI